MSVQVRDAVEADMPLIVEFNQRLAFESEGKRLDDAVIAAGVRRAFGLKALCRYFVAEDDGRMVGQCMITYEVTDWRDGLIYWLQSVYVAPEARGKGVFRKLYDHVLAAAARAGDVRMVRLYVEQENSPAIAVYERLGMERSGYHLYEVGIKAP